MLSRVLKGSGAREVPAMTFAIAQEAAVENHRLLSPSPMRPPAPNLSTETEAALNDKIRQLEAQIAVAKRDAFEAGRQQGEQSARAAAEPVLERLTASIVSVVNLRSELRRSAEKDAVGLALKIAQRVLHRELSTDANALNALARVVFDRLTRAETWQLTVHPQFADSIRGALPAASLSRVKIEADPACSPGTFVVRSTEGSIDASVDSQLAEIGRGLTDRLERT